MRFGTAEACCGLPRGLLQSWPRHARRTHGARTGGRVGSDSSCAAPPLTPHGRAMLNPAPMMPAGFDRVNAAYERCKDMLCAPKLVSRNGDLVIQGKQPPSTVTATTLHSYTAEGPVVGLAAAAASTAHSMSPATVDCRWQLAGDRPRQLAREQPFSPQQGQRAMAAQAAVQGGEWLDSCSVTLRQHTCALTIAPTQAAAVSRAGFMQTW